MCNFGTAFRLLYGGKRISAAFSPRRGIVGTVINHAYAAFVYHLAVAFNICGFARFGHMLGVISVIVALQKIGFVTVIYIWVFRPHINSFYVGVFFF